MLRPPPPHELKPSHTDGELIGRAPGELGPSKYKQIQQILIGGIIVGIVGLLMIHAFYKARRPAYMTDCMGRLHILGQALEMYSGDHEMRLPPASTWRYALSAYIDELGGISDEAQQARRLARPRGFSSPMRCQANRTTNPISYFYLDPSELGYRDLDEPDVPVLVDETHHPKVIVLRADWSCGTIQREAWVTERGDVLQIARRPDWPDTFAYVSIRPPPPPPPEQPFWDRPTGPPPWQAEATGR